MAPDKQDLNGKAPLYAILFNSTQDPSAPYIPFYVRPGDPKTAFADDLSATMPHGVAREIVTALPGLWYCMHLPNIFPQLTDMSFAYIQAGQSLSLDHQFFFAPVQIFTRDFVAEWESWTVPVLAICPDDIFEVVSANARDLGFPLPTTPYSKLSDASLAQHWRAIYDYFDPDSSYLGHEPKLSRRLDLAPTSLPTNWLERQIKRDTPEEGPGDLASFIRRARELQNLLAHNASLEMDQRAGSKSSSSNDASVEGAEVGTLHFPVTLALPGVAGAYLKKAYPSAMRRRIEPLAPEDVEDTWAVDMHHRPDSMVERSTIELITAHRAIAQTGVGLMMPSVPPGAFVDLAAVEKHFVDGPNGLSTAYLLTRLNQTASPIWTEAALEAVNSASSLTVFSNFPLGLLTLPGDTSPLSTRVPVSYRPINPLSQAMQRELIYTTGIDFSQGFSILVAECIPTSDPVGVVSRSAWKAAQEFFRNGSYPITFEVVETPTISDLRRMIAEKSPGVLVLSAHGAYKPELNFAALMIGNQLCAGPELGELPPVVMLSACHVAPRGAGAITIADLLLRQGAMAVLGTQVPVDVYHNSILLTRLFLYLAESQANQERYRTLLEAWHHVQRSNAVNDILWGNRHLRKWGLKPRPDGRSILGEFMDSKSVGQLHSGHIYRDTERVLGEMADEEGMGGKVRNWFRRPGYIPETLFYSFTGMPERVYLRSVSVTT